MKFLLTLLLIAQSYCALANPTDLSPGDVAIIGFNFTDPDEFSFVSFVDLAPGTVIYFTDCGWRSDNSFRVGEGILTYTVPAGGIQAGGVVTHGIDPGFTEAGVSGFFGFSVDGDQIFIYQGSFSSPEFIFALNSNESSWQSNAVDNNTSALPSALTEGLNAVAVNEINNASYNCFSNALDKNLILSEITKPSNWFGSNTVRMSLPTPCFDASLPVEMISFDVTASDSYNLIKFKLCNQRDVQLYEIQRSDDGINYNSIADIIPIINQECSSYSYIDYNLENGYYRLKEITINGEVIYYKSVFVSRNHNDVIAYNIYDINGILILECSESLADENAIISKLDIGFYIIKIITQSENIIRKIYKE